MLKNFHLRKIIQCQFGEQNMKKQFGYRLQWFDESAVWHDAYKSVLRQVNAGPIVIHPLPKYPFFKLKCWQNVTLQNYITLLIFQLSPNLPAVMCFYWSLTFDTFLCGIWQNKINSLQSLVTRRCDINNQLQHTDCFSREVKPLLSRYNIINLEVYKGPARLAFRNKKRLKSNLFRSEVEQMVC